MKTTTSSGIIATYNQEAFVADSVGSLASQVDELIVIDDCSTDRTMSILSSLNLANVTVLQNEENLGVSASLNKAIEQSKGDVLVFSGGDDVSLPGRVDAQLSVFSQHGRSGIGFVYSNPEVINQDGQLIETSHANEFLFEETEFGILGDLLFHGNFICAPSVAISREAFREAGGFHPNLLFTQDHDLWIRVLSLGYRAHKLSKPTVLYRKHSSNLSRRVARRSTEARNLRQLAELSFIISDFFENVSKDSLLSLAKSMGKQTHGLETSEIKILLATSSNNLFASRYGSKLFFQTSRNVKSEFLSSVEVDEIAARADVLSILEKKQIFTNQLFTK